MYLLKLLLKLGAVASIEHVIGRPGFSAWS